MQNMDWRRGSGKSRIASKPASRRGAEQPQPFCARQQQRLHYRYFVPTFKAAGSCAATGLERFQHRQQDNSKQEDNRHLVEEPVKHMGMPIAIFVDGVHKSATLQVVDHKKGDPGQF